MYRAVRFVPAEIYGIIITGEAHQRCGDRDTATRQLDEGLERAQLVGMRFPIGYAHRLLGEMALETDAGKAAEHFTKAIAIFQEIGTENELAMAYAGYGRYYRLQGNKGEARSHLTKALEIFERLGSMMEPDRVREELGQLPEV